MTNKTSYTLKDGTVLKVGDVYEATPEGYLRMVAHHVEMFGLSNSKEYWLSSGGSDYEWSSSHTDILLFRKKAPFTIIWLPEQADDNVIPPDEVNGRLKDRLEVWLQCPVSGKWDCIDPILYDWRLAMKIEWLIAKGVTFYKSKPEGV